MSFLAKLGINCAPFAKRKSGEREVFSDECPLTKNMVWRRAVSGDDVFALTQPVQPVLGGQVWTDGNYGKELVHLFERRRCRSEPDAEREGSTPSASGETPTPAGAVTDCSPTTEAGASPMTVSSTPAANLDFGEELTTKHLFELTSDDQALRAILAAACQHRLLVKTIKNDGWEEVSEKLVAGPFRTSTTLIPVYGFGMRLFAEPYRAMAGLIWDTHDVDFSTAYMWPSGYFAKTEFNMNADGTLAQGRAEALVSLEQLRAANDSKEFKDFLTGKVVHDSVMPYNEVLVTVDPSKLIGVFARSTQIKHLLAAMGARDHLAQILPQLGSLPIILHDPENGVRPFTRAAQWHLVHRCLKLDVPMKLHFPLDLRVLSPAPGAAGMNPLDQLRFHAKFGITEDALHDVVDYVRGMHGEPLNPKALEDGEVNRKMRFAECAAFALLALDFAVDADNEESALSVVRNVVPLVFGNDATGVGTGVGTGPLQQPCMAPQPSGVFIAPIAEPSVTLKSLLANAKSKGVRVAVGSCLALESYTNGRCWQKVSNAMILLQEWLAHANKMSFRLQSLMDEKKERCHRMPSPQELGTFVSDRIISNRTFFLQTLQAIRDSEDRVAFFRQLKELAHKLGHPCLRLHVLQGILGLDESYDRDTVVAVLDLAYDLVVQMDTQNANANAAEGAKN